jgi:hypothetical protein
LLARPRPFYYTVMTKSFIDAALRASYSAVSQSRKARTYSRTYTRGLVVITRHLESSSETRFGKVSISQP